jgi:hypothetical protein
VLLLHVLGEVRKELRICLAHKHVAGRRKNGGWLAL